MTTSNRILLGVNIDHVATLRQARGTRYPDPVKAALDAEEAGADGITVHLREDRRHIQERDVLLLHAAGDPHRLLALLDGLGVAGKQLHVAAPPGGDPVLTLVISRENLHEEERLRRTLDAALPGATRLVDGLGAVSAIGSGINASYDNVRRGSAALEAAGIAVAGLACETSTFTPSRTQAEAFHPRRGPEIIDKYAFIQPGTALGAAAHWRGVLIGHALPGGVVTRGAFESLAAEIVRGLREHRLGRLARQQPADDRPQQDQPDDREDHDGDRVDQPGQPAVADL